MYFQEPKKFETRSWYLVLRGLVNVLLGGYVYLRPDLATDLVMQLFGAWLILNNLVQIERFFLQHRTRRLLPEPLSTGVIGLNVGILALIKTVTAIEIATLLIGLLLFLRSIIELIILVESRMRVRHQKRLILWVILSFLFGWGRGGSWSWLVGAGGSALTTLVTYLVFVKLFALLLPKGIFYF